MTTSVILQNDKSVTVQLSKARWNRLLKLEESYKLARSIRRGMNQVTTAPKMNTTDAVNLLRSL